MSALGFDPRPYCERLAKVTERFTFSVIPKTDIWIFTDCLRQSPPDCHLITSTWVEMEVRLWSFFGPLADECGIRPSDLVAYEGGSRSLLESIIAAVVEWFESQNKSEARQ